MINFLFLRCACAASFLLGCLLFPCLLFGNDELSRYVLVSVSPHKFFVEKIAGETVAASVMVPAGASAHTYEPTPKQMLAASKADIWFRIGEAFETKAIYTLESYSPRLKVIDLRRDLDLLPMHCADGHFHCCHINAYDLHFWLSPKLAKIQASTIASALIEAYPENAELYQANLANFHEELDALDLQITAILKPLKQRTIMVSHPAYAYFCRDYNLKQLSIEFEGKDPTPQVLTKTINRAKELGIRFIFIQPQYSNKGAKLIALQIGALTVSLDPYSENYIESTLKIACAFAQESKE